MDTTVLQATTIFEILMLRRRGGRTLLILATRYSTLYQLICRGMKLDHEGDLSSEFCLVGSGSAVFKVSAPVDGNISNMMVNFSWQENPQRNEIENILYTRRILKNCADLKDDSPGEARYDACANKKCYKERRLRTTIVRYYHTLAGTEYKEKFRKLIVQVVECEYTFSFLQFHWHI